MTGVQTCALPILNMIEKLRVSATSRKAIQNIIDEVIALYLSTIYKLRNLS